MSQKHLFSLYNKELSTTIQQMKIDEQILLNEELTNRISQILRLHNNDTLILFDHNINVEVELTINKKGRHEIIYGTIKRIDKNIRLKPEIILYPALLKKTSFEEIYYVAAQMGATTIQPLITQKVSREWGGKKEQNRLELIAIAAMEQAKQFSFPQMHQPQEISSMKFESNSKTIKKIYFEVGTKPCAMLAQELIQNNYSKILVAFGPEGGFTNKDLTILHHNGFEGYALTPTILRSIEAITVGLGIIRSLTIC